MWGSYLFVFYVCTCMYVHAIYNNYNNYYDSLKLYLVLSTFEHRRELVASPTGRFSAGAAVVNTLHGDTHTYV